MWLCSLALPTSVEPIHVDWRYRVHYRICFSKDSVEKEFKFTLFWILARMRDAKRHSVIPGKRMLEDKLVLGSEMRCSFLRGSNSHGASAWSARRYDGPHAQWRMLWMIHIGKSKNGDLLVELFRIVRSCFESDALRCWVSRMAYTVQNNWYIMIVPSWALRTRNLSGQGDPKWRLPDGVDETKGSGEVAVTRWNRVAPCARAVVEMRK